MNGFPWWLSGKEPACQCNRCWFDPWVREILLKKEMASYSSTLAWKSLWTGKPGWLQSMDLQKSQTRHRD